MQIMSLILNAAAELPGSFTNLAGGNMVDGLPPAFSHVYFGGKFLTHIEFLTEEI